MSGRIENAFAVRKIIRACGTARARRNHPDIGTVSVHGIDLIALMSIARRLKDQLFDVRGKVRFSILAAEAQLAQIAQVRLLRQSQAGACSLSRPEFWRGIIETK